MRKHFRYLLPALALGAMATLAAAQDIASFEKRIAVKKLPNGLTLMLMERPEAPVFSYVTLVDAGNVQDPLGSSGIAHMFEHMAFKGTDKIGTTNFPAEKAALAEVEKTYAAYEFERRKLHSRDEKKLAALEAAWKAAIKKADAYVLQNEFDEIIRTNGAVGVNASTSMDETSYYYSMPANRLELWAYLESERFLRPVMREFYKERDVVLEERKFRIDSSPTGRLLEQFIGAAFLNHPYGRWMAANEITSYSATDAEQFYRKYYVPANTVVAVVGDLKIAQAMPLLERYFGRLPAAPPPEPSRTLEPPQNSERTVVIRDKAQPFYWEGYHRGDYMHPDDAVYDVISDILSNGRTSRLYRSLVRDQKIALFAGGGSGFPGPKYPNLFVFQAAPMRGKQPQEMGAAIQKELERLKNEDVTDDELQMAKTRAKASLIRGLGSNPGLASQLATYQMRNGDWREMFRAIDKVEKVTKADIRRVAAATFVANNRTVAMIVNEPAPAAPASAPAKGGQ